MYRLKNWHKYQSLRKDRQSSPWVKLHKSLISDYDFIQLTESQRYQFIGLLLLADPATGILPDRTEEIKFKLHLSKFDYSVFTKFLEQAETPRQSDDGNHMATTWQPAGNQLAPESREEKSREEKRREEYIAISRFDAFWESYPGPYKNRKADTRKYFKENCKSEKKFNAIMQGLDRATKSEGWLKENGKYIPAPMKFLKERRWEDEFDHSSDISQTENMEGLGL